MNSTFGRHLVAEYYGCQASVLNDADKIRELLEQAAIEAGATIVQTVSHTFTPQGASVVVVIEESHLSIHTWPEVGYAAVDFYTCGDCDPHLAHDVITAGLHAASTEVVLLHRGLRTASQSIRLVEQVTTDHSDSEITNKEVG